MAALPVVITAVLRATMEGIASACKDDNFKGTINAYCAFRSYAIAIADAMMEARKR